MPKIKLNCSYCGNEFERDRWKAFRKSRPQKNYFCSVQCSWRWTERYGPHGEDHPGWKGGRYITQNGYIRIFLPNHSMATTNGWIFEHIAIACKKIGRLLNPNENVHHKDGDKQNNHPDNLQIVTRSQHMRLHFGNPIHRQEDEPNPFILCACGCGMTQTKYDNRGRPRSFIHGHNR